jgi:hypothetical protein
MASNDKSGKKELLGAYFGRQGWPLTKHDLCKAQAQIGAQVVYFTYNFINLRKNSPLLFCGSGHCMDCMHGWQTFIKQGSPLSCQRAICEQKDES